jgi:uncharacterized protein YkwD
MHASARRHLHPCSHGHAAVGWLGVSILALLLMILSALGACAATRTASASAAEAIESRTPKHTPKPTPVACANAGLQPTAGNLAAIDAATLCLVNQMRATYRLHPLRFSNPLQSVAAGQAQDMVKGDYFGDESLSGQTPMQRILATTYPAHAARVKAAQNIGWATGPLATPTRMVQSWMLSPRHREIILTPNYRDIGVGVTAAAPSTLAGGLAGATYTLELGQRIFAARVSRKR